MAAKIGQFTGLKENTNKSNSHIDYELIDYGNGRKLERFGDIALDRPEILAYGKPALTKAQWISISKGVFIEKMKTKGSWTLSEEVPDSWVFVYSFSGLSWRINLSLSPFKHIGVFPEQEENWKFLMQNVKKGDRVLNLFGYTGAATLCAAIAGGDVFHVDSSKSIVKKASENAKLSGIEGIHWVVEDALAFAQREVKRGNRYRFIIMDPPIYGRGKRGEHWKLEDLLPTLVETAAKLLSKNGVLILNTYSQKVQLNDMTDIAKRQKLKIRKKGWLSVSGKNRQLNLSRFIICASA
ncbi:MAG: class I SAM-dependent methyltransferase [Flavobacteriales bacterium]|nr:class I SAM-dependent methyltransferase [Flavobacteriales bacterium]